VDKSLRQRLYVDEHPGQAQFFAQLTHDDVADVSSDVRVPHGLPESPANDIEQFFDVSIGIALFGGCPHAALDVVFEDQQGDRVHGGPERCRLLQDVDAVLAALDHSFDAPNLTLDTPQTPDQDRLIARIRMAEGRIQLGRVGSDAGCIQGCGGRLCDAPFRRLVLYCQLWPRFLIAGSIETSHQGCGEVQMIPVGSIRSNPPDRARHPRMRRADKLGM
jgi:hypothetical protein